MPPKKVCLSFQEKIINKIRCRSQIHLPSKKLNEKYILDEINVYMNET